MKAEIEAVQGFVVDIEMVWIRFFYTYNRNMPIETVPLDIRGLVVEGEHR